MSIEKKKTEGFQKLEDDEPLSEASGGYYKQNGKSFDLYYDKTNRCFGSTYNELLAQKLDEKNNGSVTRK